MSEQLNYTVVKKYQGFELRSYPAYSLAQVQVRGDFITAGNSAFNPLLRYITGNNAGKAQMAMTAPVLQTSVEPDHHLVSFALPASVSVGSAPIPTDSSVHVVEVSPHLAVARRFSGFWDFDRFLTQAEQLQEDAEEAIRNGDLVGQLVGEPYFARYNSPFSPFFLRRNEVLIGFDDTK